MVCVSFLFRSVQHYHLVRLQCAEYTGDLLCLCTKYCCFDTTVGQRLGMHGRRSLIRRNACGKQSDGRQNRRRGMHTLRAILARTQEVRGSSIHISARAKMRRQVVHMNRCPGSGVASSSSHHCDLLVLIHILLQYFIMWCSRHTFIP